MPRNMFMSYDAFRFWALLYETWRQRSFHLKMASRVTFSMHNLCTKFKLLKLISSLVG